MPEKPLKRAKHSSNKAKEKEATAALTLLLKDSNVLTHITGGDDDFPNIDGYFYLLDKNREITGQMLQVQIKPLYYNADRTQMKTTCRTTLLAHAQGTTTPVLVIGVDAEARVAYWTYLSPELVSKYIEEKGTEQQKTTIYFPAKNKIEAGSAGYVKQWRDICRHHRNESNDKIILKLLDETSDVYSSDAAPERIDTLRQLAFYRTTNGTFPVIEPILALAPIVFGSEPEAKIAYIKALEEIFHHKIEEVLPILYKLLLGDEKVFENLKKLLTEVSKYNYHILTSIGYEPQRQIVDTIDQLLTAEDEKFRLLAIEILRNVIEPDFDGTSSKGYTITFHRGSLQGSPYLARLRRETIDKLFEVVEGTSSVSTKLSALEALSHALHSGDSIADAAMLAIINDDTKYILNKYRSIILDEAGNPIESFPLVYEVEHQLAMLEVWKRPVAEIDPFLETLRTAKTDYRFYRLFTGNEHDLRLDAGYDAASRDREQEIKTHLASVNEGNVDEWYSRFTKIASYRDTQDFWRFNTFRDFLARIAVQKPKVADSLLERIFKDKGDLYHFVGSILFELRSTSLPLWDKYVGLIKNDKSLELTIAVLTSFEAVPLSELKLRAKDILLLKETASASGDFAFLKKSKNEWNLRYQSFRSLLYTYSKNPETFRPLILKQLKDNPGYEARLFDQLGYAIHFQWIDLSSWSKADLGEMANLLVQSKAHDHNHDQIMHEVGKIDFELMMSIYERRLEHSAKKYGSSYRAIAYHITPDLVGFIRQHPQYETTLRSWISKAKAARDMSNIHMGKLINQIGGDAYANAVKDLIGTGKDSDLKKIIALFPFTEAPDFDLCFEIIDATDNKEIWRSITGQMLTTGGWGGNINENVYGNLLRGIRERVQKKMESTESERIKAFSLNFIGVIDLQITDADEKHAKEMEKMRELSESDDD